MGFIGWCDRVIKSGFFLLFALVPLLLTPWNYELFEYNKMMGVYSLTVIIASAWVIKMIAQKEIRLKRTPLDIPIILFTLSQLVSAVFSIDPHVSWFGYYSRFNGGVWSVISYVILYYAFVSNSEIFSSPKQNKSVFSIRHSVFKLLKASLFTAALVALYGVLEHLGIDKHIWVQDVQNRVFSTLGQPNWLAAYLVALTPLTWFFALNTQYTKTNTQKRAGGINWILSIVYWILSALFFLVILYSRSRSGLLGLAVADVVFWGFLLVRQKNAIIKPVIVIHALFALVIFFNGTYISQIDKYATLAGWTSFANKVTPLRSDKIGATSGAAGYVAPALESGGTESGTIRKYVWQAAITAWQSTTKTKLIGTGTETFAFAFYQFRPVAHNQTSEWDFLYNKAHNEYLNYLATTGIFGLGSYILFIGTCIWWLITMLRKEKQEEESLLSIALFSGWLSILVTNFFGFSVVVTQLVLFLFPAIAISMHDTESPSFLRLSLKIPEWVTWLPCIVALWLLYSISSIWYADKQFALGYQYDRAGLFAQATPSLLTAIGINPQEPLYHDELAGSYAALSVGSFSAKNATQSAHLAELALSESDKATHISPKNVNFLKTRTKVYYTLSTLDPSFNKAAIDTLLQAADLSPNDPKIYYNLAILAGRDGQNDQAISYLLRAKTLKPDYRDVYNALNIFYTETGNKNAAKTILQEYLTKINPDDTDFKTRIAK